MKLLEKLQEIRSLTSAAETVGLEDELILKMAAEHPDLETAIDQAHREFHRLKTEYAELFQLPEADLIHKLQEGFVNFYDEDTVNPYVAIAAKGPWLVTSHGAVLHDSGGYGMLGFGHSPSAILPAMNQEHVMANIMTASFSQHRLISCLHDEIGHSRQGDFRHPFAKFLCLNSGSEAVTVAARLADLHANTQTSPGGRYDGRQIMMLAMKGGFHGRTERPAQASDSSLPNYQRLASFRDRKNLVTVEVNNIESLEAAFRRAEDNSWYYEMMFMEPVMGEGNPGVGVQRAFYDRARELTKKMGSLLLVDSIQAGLRAHGCLSITDYPGFQDCEAPDLETYSKAVNAGQYPLSILGMTKAAASLYVRGIYGNTMTANPRALEVACAVLKQVTPELRKNIQERGKEFLQLFEELKEEFPTAVTNVSGTGLLCALHLNPEGYRVVGKNCIEKYLRKQGVGVIHGGKNALRFTPHFLIRSNEVQMIGDKIREALKRGPVYS
ncbi:MAG: aminotransferase class III-fold pyridoxal phosphate-dependent enzyme [Oligoflexus sp.]